MGQERVITCVGFLTTQINISTSPPRESLAPVRGFLNHGQRIQVLHLKLDQQVSHTRAHTNDNKRTRFRCVILLSMQRMMRHGQEEEVEKKSKINRSSWSNVAPSQPTPHLQNLALIPTDHKSHIPQHTVSSFYSTLSYFWIGPQYHCLK